jgi:hypothetical protein
VASALHGRLDLHAGPLLAARGGGGGGFHGGGGFRGGGGYHGGYHGGYGYHGGVTIGPPGAGRYGGWSGYHIYGGLRGYYGPGYYYWGGPFIYPPYYSSWVFWWGPSYYPSAEPSADVLAFGLPEGVLVPGGRVTGFLYFQKATGGTRTLDLSWDAHEARNGWPLGATHVALDVVAR